MSLEAEIGKIVTGAAIGMLTEAIRNVGKRRKSEHATVARRILQASAIDAAAESAARADHATRRAARARKGNKVKP